MKKNKILIIEANYYSQISESLLSGAKKKLENDNFKYDLISVPGALEIPVIIEKFKDTYIGFITLGCVIRGETSHYDIVTNIASDHIFKVVNRNKLAHGFGLLTVEDMEQAKKRSDLERKNLGGHAAKVCLEMINLLSKKENEL
jgi:6,7-dimethyl-8-ribityllumazine synthase